MPNQTCKDCGHPASRHTKDGCAARQRLTPWDSEACMCSLSQRQVEKQK